MQIIRNFASHKIDLLLGPILISFSTFFYLLNRGDDDIVHVECLREFLIFLGDIEIVVFDILCVVRRLSEVKLEWPSFVAFTSVGQCRLEPYFH